ncbi:hypothetical protein GIB67_036671 [Kingdonia uniflora]|uniref:Glucan endo-1,3-beta-D-glucosidase n=1 Tax=Kingdonia uniflora TaxID=39325 RepID=A0A7J7LWL9_9MAGN|nr:hypothetical protein GIB67_036671 [Kingdonia uniflora]
MALISSLTLSSFSQSQRPEISIGLNWGTSASHPLPPSKVVQLLKSNNINKVKLFDADTQVLNSLSGTKIDVTVGIPNSMLKSLSSSKKVADTLVHDNLTRFLSNADRRVRISYQENKMKIALHSSSVSKCRGAFIMLLNGGACEVVDPLKAVPTYNIDRVMDLYF